jgi:hypothetical protein
MLAAARAGDLDRPGEEREAVAVAVRSFAAAGEGTLAVELVAQTWRIWFSRGEVEEGAAVAAAALAAPGAAAPSRERARVLYADGLFAFRAGDQERSRTRNEEALRGARAVLRPARRVRGADGSGARCTGRRRVPARSRPCSSGATKGIGLGRSWRRGGAPRACGRYRVSLLIQAKREARVADHPAGRERPALHMPH